jgi:hypothetical protein
MLYALLCYNSEDTVGAWSRDEEASVMCRLQMVCEKLRKEGKLGPVARLLPTTTATTLRRSRDQQPLILDGPFAETKEQLLGFYIVDCASLEEVLNVARDLSSANPGATYEIRPLGIFRPGEVKSVPA